MINCLICDDKDSIVFVDNYIHQFEEDKKYFDDAKLYKCNACEHNNELKLKGMSDFF